MISPRLRTSVLSNGHVATVVKRLKSRWSIYHSHVFRIILIGVMLHFRCSHINHWEITLYACGYLVISDILFPLISRPTDFLVILLLFLWKSICSLPTGFSLFYSLSPTSNTVPPSSFFTWFHIFVSTVAPSDTSKWFRSRHILVLCSCYILRKLQTCAHYTVGIFQKVLLNNISMLNKELIWTNAHWPISFFPPHTSEYETICQMQFSFIREQKDPATEVYQPWSTAKGCSCTAIFLETQRTMCLFNYVVLEAHNI